MINVFSNFQNLRRQVINKNRILKENFSTSDKKMNILLIGSGGREHAIAKSLKESPSTELLFAAPGNPGIFSFAQEADIDIQDFSQIKQFCDNNNIRLVVVGPELPLSFGIADFLTDHNIPVFGPVRKGARLEYSKDFAKEIMKKYNIPTANYKTFSEDERIFAHEYISSSQLPIVLKADGLASGKGVIIAHDYETAHTMIDKMFDGIFGDAGDNVVIEEFLDGEEASVFAITDGENFITLPPSQDHKKAFDGDEGPNTGGMGAYAPAKVVNSDVLLKIQSQIVKPLIEGLKAEGIKYRGCIYCGLMIKNNEAKVIEFNVRFGDPETQAVLPLVKGDFAKLLYTAALGALEKDSIEIINDKFTCCVVAASDGYPEAFEKGFEIHGLEEAENSNVFIYHAGTKLADGKVISHGGRVLGVTAIANDLKSAIYKAYEACHVIDFDNIYYRYDIGEKGL